MSRVSKENTVIVSTNTTITANSAVTVFSQVINLDGAIGLSFQAAYTWTTAPTAGKQLDFYLIFSPDNTTFDTSAVSTMQQIASFVLDADTSQQVVSITVDGALCVAKYAKVAVVTNEATNAGTMNSLIATVAKAV